MDAYVRLTREVSGAISLNSDQWRTIVAVGGGTSVRRLADDLSLGEIPVCRAVKELIELGLADVDGSSLAEPVASAPMADPQSARAELDALAASLAAEPAAAATDPDVFVPLDLSHLGSPSKAPAPASGAVVDEAPEAMFPGLAAQAATLAEATDDIEMGPDELVKQLATLSPRAAKAVQAAAAATTDEERDAVLAAVEADEDEPLNRGLLLKFLSSVRS
jgi:hypothetical protein